MLKTDRSERFKYSVFNIITVRLQITLSAKKTPEFLDFNHNYWLASAIYRAIGRVDASLSLELHKPSVSKFFTFSRLFVKGKKFEIQDGKMKILSPELYFFFSSLKNYLCVCLIEGLLQKPEVKIGSSDFLVSEVKVVREKEIKSKARFVTLSPINVTTAEKRNGKLRTVDLYPDNPKFYENLKQNLVKKYRAFHGREPESEELNIRVVRAKPVRIKVKDTYHRASLMVFDAEGDKGLLEMGYKAGFGSKTSMGFGMVKAL